MPTESDCGVTKSCGNVFADLGLEDADELLMRAELGRSIRLILEKCGYKQHEAANILGVAQSEISQLMNGRYNLFSEGRLLSFLNKLDYTTTIKITPTKKGEKQQQVIYP